MDPLTILALALTAAGTGASYVGNRKAQDAQAQTMGNARERNEKLDKQAFDINEKSRKRFGEFDDKQAKKEGALTDMFQSAGEGAPSFGPAASDSNITVAHEAEKRGEAKDYTDQQGAARAKLLSFGDVLGDASLGQSRDVTKLHGIEGFRRGWEGVLPAELGAAAEQGGGWRLGGDLLKGAGTVATMGALSGASMPSGITNLLGGVGGNAPLAGTNMLAKQQAGPLLSLFM